MVNKNIYSEQSGLSYGREEDKSRGCRVAQAGVAVNVLVLVREHSDGW